MLETAHPQQEELEQDNEVEVTDTIAQTIRLLTETVDI